MGNSPTRLDLSQTVVSVKVFERRPESDELLAPLLNLLGSSRLAVIAETQNSELYRIELGSFLFPDHFGHRKFWNRSQDTERVSKNGCLLAKMSDAAELAELQRSPWSNVKTWRDPTGSLELKHLFSAASGDDIGMAPDDSSEQIARRLLDLPLPSAAEALRHQKLAMCAALLALVAASWAVLNPAASLSMAAYLQVLLFCLLLWDNRRTKRLQQILCLVILAMLLVISLTGRWNKEYL